MVPIFKKGTKSLPSNYRPVSLTSIVGKILERLTKDHMDEFLLEKKYLSSRQHRFMKDRSCQTNLISFYEEVSKTLDREGGIGRGILGFCKSVQYSSAHTAYV